MEDNPRVIGVGRMDVSPMVFAMQQKDRYPRARNARSYEQNPVGDKGHNKGSLTKEEVFTIFRGLYEVGRSCSARDRYAQEARCPPTALVHQIDVHSVRGTTRELEDIIFTEANTK